MSKSKPSVACMECGGRVSGSARTAGWAGFSDHNSNGHPKRMQDASAYLSAVSKGTPDVVRRAFDHLFELSKAAVHATNPATASTVFTREFREKCLTAPPKKRSTKLKQTDATLAKVSPDQLTELLLSSPSRNLFAIIFRCHKALASYVSSSTLTAGHLFFYAQQFTAGEVEWTDDLKSIVPPSVLAWSPPQATVADALSPPSLQPDKKKPKRNFEYQNVATSVGEQAQKMMTYVSPAPPVRTSRGDSALQLDVPTRFYPQVLRFLAGLLDDERQNQTTFPQEFSESTDSSPQEDRGKKRSRSSDSLFALPPFLPPAQVVPVSAPEPPLNEFDVLDGMFDSQDPSKSPMLSQISQGFSFTQ